MAWTVSGDASSASLLSNFFGGPCTFHKDGGLRSAVKCIFEEEGALSPAVQPALLPSHAKLQRCSWHAAFLERGGSNSQQHSAGLLETKRGLSARALRVDAGSQMYKSFLCTAEADAARRARHVSFVAPIEQEGRANHTNGQEHEGGSHHEKDPKTAEEQHCEKATNITSCIDLEHGCVWSMDNVGDPSGGGSCSYSKTEEWPEGFHLYRELLLIPTVELAILSIAVNLRKFARPIIAAGGMDPTRSDLRRMVWLLPTTAVYVLSAVAYMDWNQGWTAASTIYFLAQVVTTVGYGDLAPTYPLAKVFTMFHILSGLCIVGGALGDELDSVVTSRVQRLIYKVNESAGWMYQTSRLWPRVVEIQQMIPDDRWRPLVDMLRGMYDIGKLDSPNQAQVQDGLRRLGIDAGSPGERALMAEIFHGTDVRSQQDQDPEFIVEACHIDMQTLRMPGERLRVLIPLMTHADQSREAPVFSITEAMEQFADGKMMDTWTADLFIPSLQQFMLTILVIGAIFGAGDELLYEHDARTLMDSMYMAVVTTTTVGFGDIVPLLGEERVVGCICMFAGVYYCNRFLLSSAELFAWKTELTTDLIKLLPAGFGRKLQQLQTGGDDRANFLARRLQEQGVLKSSDRETVCETILQEYDAQMAEVVSKSQ